MAIGFTFGIIAVSELLRWVYALWTVWLEYKTALRFPHLKRRARLWPLALLSVCHSGPWFLGVIIFITYKVIFEYPQPEWLWLLGGFYSYPIIIGGGILLSLHKDPHKFTEEHKP